MDSVMKHYVITLHNKDDVTDHWVSFRYYSKALFIVQLADPYHKRLVSAWYEVSIPCCICLCFVDFNDNIQQFHAGVFYDET